MKNRVNYQDLFEQAESYLGFLMAVQLNGGNKAVANRFLQKTWEAHTSFGRLGSGKVIFVKKLVLFIKQGVNEGEIPMKFIWNMLGCPKNIEELQVEY